MGGISGAIGNATGQGGKGGFGAPQQSGGQPQMGFGPAPIEQNPMDTFGGGLNFGGMGFGIQGNQPAPTNNFGGGLAGAAMNAIQSNQPAPQPMPTSGMGGGSFGGKGGFNWQPQGPRIGFGPAPIEQNPMNIFGLADGFQGPQPPVGSEPGAQNYNRQSPIIGSMPAGGSQPSGIGNFFDPVERGGCVTIGGGMGIQGNQPAPQPVNRFAPPNAPGVRQQPRTAPRAGIPVQSARTVQPNRFTRNRTR